MSYLNSILSSIGGNEQAPKASTVKPPSRTASPLNKPNGTSANGVAPPANLSTKRKAEDDVAQSRSIANKVPRTDTKPLPARPIAAASLKPIAKPATNGSSSAGSSRPSSAGQIPNKPMIKTTTNTGVGKAPVTPASAGAAPKKGSFAETLARAAAAQKASTAKPSLGTIQHKPTEKLTAQEKKKAKQEQAKNPKLAIKGARSGSRPLSRSQSPEKSKLAMAAAQKLKKPPVDLGYKGTMRSSAPAAPSYRGTMRPGGVTSTPKEKESIRHAGYASYSEDDLDEVEEDYDDLSDMEAGMDEVDDEEEASLAIARREDLAAKKEEERLRREKEQRKKLVQRR